MSRVLRLLAVLAICIGALHAQTAQTPVPAPVITPVEHVRGVEQTFLTYPEWFLVFSPAEYASFIDKSPPDQFPYLGHVGQFWQGYKAVFDESQAMGRDLNPGYHLMVMVIGVSTTVEYTLKSVYEGLIGRLSQATTSARTPEDVHAAKVAQDYVDVIRVLPWYEYDFWRQLKALWTDVPMTGPNMIRKWERRFALTTEYGIKTVYAQIIKLATQSIYETPLLVTAMVVQPPPEADPKLPELKVLKTLPDGAALITVPRYEAFMVYAQALAAKNINFSEVAGNRSIMLVSLIGDTAWQPTQGIEKVLLEQPILTQPGRKRIVATAKVPQLGAALREWSTSGVQVEHLFDY